MQAIFPSHFCSPPVFVRGPHRCDFVLVRSTDSVSCQKLKQSVTSSNSNTRKYWCVCVCTHIFSVALLLSVWRSESLAAKVAHSTTTPSSLCRSSADLERLLQLPQLQPHTVLLLMDYRQADLACGTLM